MSIVVDDGVVSADVRVKSGMVRQVVSLALRLAAASRAVPGWVILDEVDGAMRSRAREATATILQYAATVLGLQVIVVTQHDDTAQRFGARIKVTRGEAGAVATQEMR